MSRSLASSWANLLLPAATGPSTTMTWYIDWIIILFCSMLKCSMDFVLPWSFHRNDVSFCQDKHSKRCSSCFCSRTELDDVSAQGFAGLCQKFHKPDASLERQSLATTLRIPLRQPTPSSDAIHHCVGLRTWCLEQIQI